MPGYPDRVILVSSVPRRELERRAEDVLSRVHINDVSRIYIVIIQYPPETIGLTFDIDRVIDPDCLEGPP